MASHKEHRALTRAILGYDYRGVHRVMDAPAKIYGKYHRRYYHDTKTAVTIGLFDGVEAGIASAFHTFHDRYDSAIKRESRKTGNSSPPILIEFLVKLFLIKLAISWLRDEEII